MTGPRTGKEREGVKPGERRREEKGSFKAKAFQQVQPRLAWIEVSVYQELSNNSAKHSLSRVYIRHAK